MEEESKTFQKGDLIAIPEQPDHFVGAGMCFLLTSGPCHCGVDVDSRRHHYHVSPNIYEPSGHTLMPISGTYFSDNSDFASRCMLIERGVANIFLHVVK